MAAAPQAVGAGARVVSSTSSHGELDGRARLVPQSQVIKATLRRMGQSLSRMPAEQTALILIAATLAVVWLEGSYNHFIPCAQDCGETFLALQSIANYNLYGLKYWLLQDHSTIPDPNRHAFIYTHNPHLGTLLFPLLDHIGISTVWGKQLVTLLASGAGLFYVFLTVRYVTKSVLIGLCVLALFCTDYAGVFAFALNALRAWHWLALFGLIYHSLQILSGTAASRIGHLFAVTVFSVLAFSIGYEFLAIALAITLFIALFCARSVERSILCLGWLAGSVMLIFAARQAQVIAVLGVNFWLLDLFYSVGIKLTSVATYLKLPSLPEIDDFYRGYGVLRPFAAVAPVEQVVLGIVQHLQKITFPSVGLGATACWLAAAVFSIVIVGAWIFSLAFKASFVDRLQHRAMDWIDAIFSARFFLAQSLGTIVGLIAFGSVTVSIYLKHQMPLMAAALLIPKGAFTGLGLRLAFGQCRYQVLRVTAAILAAALIADHVAIQFQNLAALRPMPVGWIPEVVKRQDATFAVSWIPSSVAAFSRNWVTGIQPGLEWQIIDRVNRGDWPFTETDLLEVNTLYKEDIVRYRLLQPDYWLYFATDQKAELQGTLPACTRSYSRRLFDELLSPPATAILKRISFVARPDMRLFTGEINLTGRAVSAVELNDGDKVLARTGLYCDESTFAGALPLSIDPTEGSKEFLTIDAINYNGARHSLGSLDASSARDVLTALPASLPHHQIDAEMLIELNRTLPIAAKGPGFVLFDLRHLWTR
jgi:hypothetical protein